jgi:hypothetical protein
VQEQRVSAVIMVGQRGTTHQEQLVHDAVVAAAKDLIDLLDAVGVRPVVVAGPDLSWVSRNQPVIVDEDVGVFHFGQRLADLIERHALSPVMYFGGGSAPLLTQDLIELMHGMLFQSEYTSGSRIPTHIVVTNNLHSSDWVGMTRADDALETIRQASRDNSMAWMLRESRTYKVRVLSGVRPSSSMDLDTPADLAVVRLHSACQPHLSMMLDNPLLNRLRIESGLDVASQDGSSLALMGRVSPAAWRELNKVTQCWIRVFSEERGMVASERLARGEVKSLIGSLLMLLGPERFFSELASMVDAAIIDSRVLMAACGHYPDSADRFASDLFLTDEIADEWVRAFTSAALRAPIPVFLGGHGVVGGGLYAMAEIIAARRQ